MTYLAREGVSRETAKLADQIPGQPRAEMFDTASDAADARAFAERSANDRHHFRFIVSPEDAAEMADLRAFTRELMADAERDLDTRLDWTAIDHWNTDNPHIHILVRGRTDDGQDLVISRDYMSRGLRGRAEERATLELGPRSEREIGATLEKEVEVERWTSLDRALQRLSDEGGGVADLRPDPNGSDPKLRQLLVGRAIKLERLGLADRAGVAQWAFKPGAETTLRDLSIRIDIIKTMHQAMAAKGYTPDVSAFAIHGEGGHEPIVGRFVGRGLQDELKGTAFAIVDGADGRTHHLKFSSLDLTGDAKPGAIVELRSWQDARGQPQLSLAVRCDLPLEAQTNALGATWLDRQLVAGDPVPTAGGFGVEIRDALEKRTRHLTEIGLAKRHEGNTVLTSGIIEKLRRQELAATAERIAVETGLRYSPSASGGYVSGTYSRRLDLGSGRFAMIDDGLGFQLVPWRPAIEQKIGQHVSGPRLPSGGVDWSFGHQRSYGL